MTATQRPRLIGSLSHIKPSSNLGVRSSPGCRAQGYMDWCEAHGIEIRYIQAGKPDQNAIIERFNKSYRDAVLNAHGFSTPDQVREVGKERKTTHNEYRPHDALGRIPAAIDTRKLKLGNSSLEP